jgi:hypothetical protein
VRIVPHDTGTQACTHTHDQTHAYLSNLHALGPLSRMVHLGTYDTDEDAARVFDFAVLSVRGVGSKQAVTNFDVGAYLGADGVLLTVEAALPGLGTDTHTLVRDKLAAAVAGAGGAAEGEAEGAADSGSGPVRPGISAVGAPPPARGPAASGGAPNRDGQAPGAQQGAPAPRLPPPPQQQAQQQQLQLPPAQPPPPPHQLPLAPPPPPPHQPLVQAPPPQQAQQQLPLAPQAHALPPAHDFTTKTTALAFLRELHATFNEGVLTEEEFQEQRAQAMAALRML